MEERIIMEELTTEQMTDRFREAYDWIIQYGTESYVPIPGGNTVDDFIDDNFVFFIDVNNNLCMEVDGGEWIWDAEKGEWLQGTYTRTEHRTRFRK